jgi:hypothetical protein
MKNYHILKIKYYGPTNVSGSRVGIISERFNERVTISYDYSMNNSYEMAEKHLKQIGFNIIGVAEGKNCYYLISDTFKPLKSNLI